MPTIEERLQRAAVVIDNALDGRATPSGFVQPQSTEHGPLVELDRQGDSRRGRNWIGLTAAALIVIVVGALVVVGRRDSGAVTPADLAALPALPADLPDTGKAWLPETELTVSMAAETLRLDCYREAGYDVDGRTLRDWVAFGQWQPHPVLGIRRVGAARVLGYRAEFGDDPAVDVDSAVVDRCHQQVDGLLGDYLAIAEPIRGVIENQLQDRADTAAAQDLRIVDVLARWSDCVNDATGERAATPNELARSFVFGGAEGDQIAIATADAECQAATQLETTWYTVVTEYERAMVGDDIDQYDTLVRIRTEFIETARTVLSERGIDVPTMD